MKQKMQPVRHTITDISPAIGPQQPQSRVKQSHVKIIIAVVILLTLSVVVAGGILFVMHNRKPNYNDVQVVTERVSRHMVLPSDEKPALATVTDSSKLTSSFKGKVENGDKLLIYQNNKKAIVYRPSIDRVITIEPVAIDAAPGAQQ